MPLPANAIAVLQSMLLRSLKYFNRWLYMSVLSDNTGRHSCAKTGAGIAAAFLPAASEVCIN